MSTHPMRGQAQSAGRSARRGGWSRAREWTGIFVVLAVAGCTTLPRATCSDEEFASYVHTQAERLPISGIYELRTTAAGGHVTLGGRVDSPETLFQLVKAVANTPGLTELSFFGVEFSPGDIPDEVIVAEARAAAAEAIGEAISSQLGFYCENHRLFVYGTLPSLALRERLEEAMRQVPGVGLFHVSCEVVLVNPPSDARVVAAVRRKFRRPELANLSFRASKVEVRSVKNVVHLSGTAPTLLGKLSAGSQAAQVEGVRYVVNQIQVPGIPTPPPRTSPPTDDDSQPGDSESDVEPALLHEGLPAIELLEPEEELLLTPISVSREADAR